MTVHKARSEALLRERAESHLRKTRGVVREMKPDEIQELIHELQVHQIELRMQNEALRQVQESLENSRQKYLELYDFAPMGYLTLDRDGVILEANLTTARMLGCSRDELTGKKYNKFISPASQDAWHMYFRNAVFTGTSRSSEISLINSLRVQLNCAVSEAKNVYRISMGAVTTDKDSETWSQKRA